MPDDAERRVLVVDDHSVAREGIMLLVNSEDNLNVVAQAATCQEALEAIEEHKPDLVVTDMSLPDRSGLELIRDALARFPDLLILVISMHDEALYAERVLRAGGKGFIMKEAASEELIEAIKQVNRGEIYVSSKMASLLIRRLSGSSQPSDGSDKNSVLQVLSDRELQVFDLIGKALTNQAIADTLNISARTVDAHKTRIKEKLEIPDNNTLLVFAVRWRNLEIPEEGDEKESDEDFKQGSGV